MPQAEVSSRRFNPMLYLNALVLLACMWDTIVVQRLMFNISQNYNDYSVVCIESEASDLLFLLMLVQSAPHKKSSQIQIFIS
jgi:hypothetical protein